MKTVLHAGCGGERLPEEYDDYSELRLDIDPDCKPHVVASLTDMKGVADGSVSGVFCSHTLEHLYAHEVPLALAEFYRVLEPEGFVHIAVPNIHQVAEAIIHRGLETIVYYSPAGPVSPIDMLYGLRSMVANGNTFMSHKTGFTGDSLCDKLEAVGFRDIKISHDDGFNIIAKASKTQRPSLPRPDMGLSAASRVLHDQPAPTRITSTNGVIKIKPRKKFIAVATPTLGAVSMEWAGNLRALAWPLNTGFLNLPILDDLGGAIAEARNRAVDLALRYEDENNEITHIFWIDDDVLVPPMALLALLNHKRDICSGVYFTKGDPSEPLIFPGRGCGTHPYVPNELLEVWGHGMGLTLIRTEVYRRMRAELPLGKDRNGLTAWYKTLGDSDEILEDGCRWRGGTEDLYMLNEAEKLGYQPLVDCTKACFGWHYDVQYVVDKQRKLVQLIKQRYPVKQAAQLMSGQPITWDGGVRWKEDAVQETRIEPQAVSRNGNRQLVGEASHDR